MKIWDGLGMNDTNRCRGLVAAVVIMAGLPVRAQSPYVAASSMALPDASASTGSDPSDSILTIKKQVSEVNVLFIATDHRGKFVRNLNQGDFTILESQAAPGYRKLQSRDRSAARVGPSG